jgi:hypothetical protein
MVRSDRSRIDIAPPTPQFPPAPQRYFFTATARVISAFVVTSSITGRLDRALAMEVTTVARPAVYAGVSPVRGQDRSRGSCDRAAYQPTNSYDIWDGLQVPNLVANVHD